jgi:biopolymer transport protein ExbD
MTTQTGMARAEINITPLIDVLLVLLIIFMVIAPVKPVGLDAKLPQESDSPAEARLSDVVLAIAADRSLTLNTQPLPTEQLVSRLREVFTQRPNGVLYLKGAGALDFADVAAVIDAAHAAGVPQLGLIR